MHLPNVLIIGAMKAGTTGLYMDLATHAQVFLGQDKEPHALCSDEVLTPEGLARYAAIYAKAETGQIRIDASTGYSKRPDYEGVPQRAIEVLPADFKVIYIVRHPVERIVSQHHHEYFAHTAGPSIDDEVRRHPRYVQYSRYSYQLEPWIEAVGMSRILVIRFEDYVECRQQTVADVCRFLELPPEGCVVEDDRVYNKSQGKPVKNRLWNAVQHNSVYRKFLRPLAPLKLRLAIRRVLLPKAPDTVAPPRPDTVQYLRDALRDDVHCLTRMLGRQAPLWSNFAAEARTPTANV
jgi:Sulfotransferase domain